MPVTYEVDHQRATIRTACVSNVTFLEIKNHFRELENEPSLPTPLNVLLDLTEIQSIPDSEQVRTVASEIDKLRHKFEWGALAIVVQEDVMFGMSRMLQTLAEDQFSASNVFRNLDEAEQWLAARSPV